MFFSWLISKPLRDGTSSGFGDHLVSTKYHNGLVVIFPLSKDFCVTLAGQLSALCPLVLSRISKPVVPLYKIYSYHIFIRE